jgi:hypothetical protein
MHQNIEIAMLFISHESPCVLKPNVFYSSTFYF